MVLWQYVCQFLVPIVKYSQKLHWFPNAAPRKVRVLLRSVGFEDCVSLVVMRVFWKLRKSSLMNPSCLSCMIRTTWMQVKFLMSAKNWKFSEKALSECWNVWCGHECVVLDMAQFNCWMSLRMSVWFCCTWKTAQQEVSWHSLMITGVHYPRSCA